MATQQEPSLRPYTRTPKQERSLNPDELAKRLEAFAMLHDSPVKKTPQRRQSNAAYVPRNAGRAFQSTTTTRIETTKEAKRRTLPAGGIPWDGVDTPQNPEDGFSCAQLAYAHTQLQAYSDELRAKKSSRVLNVDDDDDLDDEGAGRDPEAYKTIPRRPEDRPNWAQGSDDEDENKGTNRLKIGAARMLHLSRAREGERDFEQEAVKRRSSNMDFTQKTKARPEPITRRSSLGDIPSRKPSLYEQEEPNEEDIMNYVKSLPRKHTPSNNRNSMYGSAQDAAVDAAKRVKAQASMNDVSHKPTSPSRPRSMLFDNDVLNSLRAIRSTNKTPVQSPTKLKSNDSSVLNSQFSRPDLVRNDSENDAQIRAREREEKALRRRTLQPDFSPSKAEKRSSWIDFRNSFRGVESFTVPDRRPDIRIDTKSMDPLPSYARDISTSDTLNSSKSMASFPSSATYTTPMPHDSMSPVSPTITPTSAHGSLGPQESGLSSLSKAPPKTMLVVQAAKKLHDAEVERRRREIQDVRQQEQEERPRKRQSYVIPEEGPVNTKFIPPIRPLSTIGLGWGKGSTVRSVDPPPRPLTTTGTKMENPPTSIIAPPLRPSTTTGTKSNDPRPSLSSPVPPLILRESARDVTPMKSSMKGPELAPKKEKKPNGLRRWFSRYFGADRK